MTTYRSKYSNWGDAFAEGLESGFTVASKAIDRYETRKKRKEVAAAESDYQQELEENRNAKIRNASAVRKDGTKVEGISKDIGADRWAALDKQAKESGKLIDGMLPSEYYKQFNEKQNAAGNTARGYTQMELNERNQQALDRRNNRQREAMTLYGKPGEYEEFNKDRMKDEVTQQQVNDQATMRSILKSWASGEALQDPNNIDWLNSAKNGFFSVLDPSYQRGNFVNQDGKLMIEDGGKLHPVSEGMQGTIAALATGLKMGALTGDFSYAAQGLNMIKELHSMQNKNAQLALNAAKTGATDTSEKPERPATPSGRQQDNHAKGGGKPKREKAIPTEDDKEEKKEK